MKTILAIDPGTTTLGYAVLTLKGEDVNLIDSGSVEFEGCDTILHKLNRIYGTVIDLLSEHQPEYVMLERTFKVDRGSVPLVVAIKLIKEVIDLLKDVKLVQENAMTVRAYHGVGARDSATAKERVKKLVIEIFDLDDDLPYDVYDAVLLGYYLACTIESRGI